MWYQRKNVTHEEAEAENKRMFALEDRVDDEFDEARINDAVSRIDWSFLNDKNKKKKRKRMKIKNRKRLTSALNK